MRALLRRSSGVPAKGRLNFHDIAMDLAAHRVQRNGRAVHLGPDGVSAAGIPDAASSAGFFHARNCWMRCGGRIFMWSRGLWTCISAACASQLMEMMSWMWFARCGRRGTL